MNEPAPQYWRFNHWNALGLAAAAYAAWIVAQWSLAYIDFGDGNYMYIGRRIADGAVVYRDILAPQPPCHLFMGALIWKVADLLNLGEPIYAFRFFTLALRIVNAALVVMLAWKAWGRAAVAVLAGVIFLWLPIGTWWSLGYQSEPLEIAFLLAMMLCALKVTRGGDIAAGVFAGLAGLTNATAAPFLLVLIVYMAIKAPRRALWMAAPCLLFVGLVTIILQLWTNGEFLVNVIKNQVGTYPPTWPERIRYGFGKILGQGGNVLTLEGGFVFLALLGVVRFLRDSPLPPAERGGVAWFLASTLGAIIYVTKGGTMDYIFSLSEPAVAILAAGELAAWAQRWRGSPFPVVKFVAAIMLFLFMSLHGIQYHVSLFQKRPYELDENNTDKVVYLIRNRSGAGDMILAPPFYAVRAGRRLWGDYSELFIWVFKYQHDLLEDMKRSESVELPPGNGLGKVRSMAAAIRNREIAFVALEMDQTGTIPEVMIALRETYVPLSAPWQREQPHHLFFTRNTRLGFFVPASGAPDPASWRAFTDELQATYGDGFRPKFGAWYATLAGGD